MLVKVIDNSLQVRTAPDPDAPVVTELKSGATIDTGPVADQNGKKWVQVTLAGGRNGFIPGETSILELTKVSLLQDQAQIYESPTLEGPVKMHLRADDVFYLAEVVEAPGKKAVLTYYGSGQAGFVATDIAVTRIEQSATPSPNTSVALSQSPHEGSEPSNGTICANLGCFSHVSGIEEDRTPVTGVPRGLVAHFEHFVYYPIEFDRPKRGKPQTTIQCPRCGKKVLVEVAGVATVVLRRVLSMVAAVVLLVVFIALTYFSFVIAPKEQGPHTTINPCALLWLFVFLPAFVAGMRFNLRRTFGSDVNVIVRTLGVPLRTTTVGSQLVGRSPEHKIEARPPTTP